MHPWESAADPQSAHPPGRPRPGALLGLAALLVVLAESVANVLPDDAVFWVFTPLRLVVAAGLLAVATACGPGRWRSPADPGVALLVVGATVTSALHGGWSSWRALLTYVAVFYLTVAVRRAGALPWRLLAPVALLAATGPVLAALAQRANGTATGFCRAGLDAAVSSCTDPGAVIRVTGTMPNPILLVAVLVILLPPAVGAAGRLSEVGGDPARAGRLLIAVLLPAAGLLAIWQTGSRAGVAAAAVCLLVLGLLGRRRARRPRVLAGVLGVGVPAAVGSVALGYSLGLRAQVWAAAVGLALAHPEGVGLGRGGPLLTDRLPDSEPFAHAHNLWLQWLLEAGWLGLLGVLWLSVAVLVVLWRADRAGSLSAVPLAAAVLGFLVLCLVDHPAGALRIALPAAVLFGWALTARVDVPAAAAGRPVVEVRTAGP